MKAERRQRTAYIVADFMAVTIGFLTFMIYRHALLKRFLTPKLESLSDYLVHYPVCLELIVFPFIMLTIYWFSGFYNNILFKSRLQVVGNTLWTSVVGALLFFFGAMANDALPRRRYAFLLMGFLIAVLFILVVIERWIISTRMSHRIKSGRWALPIAIIGANPQAIALRRRIEKARPVMGLDVIAHVGIPGEIRGAGNDLPEWTFDDLKAGAEDNIIKSVILWRDPKNPQATMEWLNRLYPLGITVFVPPATDNPAESGGRINNVAGEPLYEVSGSKMDPGMLHVKRVFDLLVSSVALIVLSPVMVAIALAVKIDSPGPVFYRQERVGYHKKQFKIVKFRSMRREAEADGPQLSSPDDERVTRLGRILRKYRLDELPNFFNVLRGDMSLVGPRPEREHYIVQMMERMPSTALLYSVRPGITSWGMVKFGYAQNVDEMLERLRYDLLYLENASISVDLKILFYTIRTVVTGRGI